MPLATQNVEEALPVEVARLTHLMRQGDEDAYRDFFRIYFHRLFAYLLTITRGNEALARDLVQQTLLKVAKHVRVFEDEDVFWRWLTVLARTAAVDERRKSQRYFTFLQRWWHGKQDESPVEETDRVGEMLLASFDQLDRDDRTVLERKYLDETSVREIAAECQTTEKAIESRLSRARVKLKQIVLEGLQHE